MADDYVTLVSAEGFEFVIERRYALISGTIKAMLSGPGQFAENETNEVNILPCILYPVCTLYL